MPRTAATDAESGSRRSHAALVPHHRAYGSVHGGYYDLCRALIPTPLDAGSTRQTPRSPRVMRTYLPPYARRIYARAFRTGLGLLIRRDRLIRFLFVEPGFSLRLPSDFTSRWTPWPSRQRAPLSGAQKNCTSKRVRPAGHTKKRAASCWKPPSLRPSVMTRVTSTLPLFR